MSVPTKENDGIIKHMRDMMCNYQNLRGKNVKESDTPFWDVVVITTADDDQKKVFESQIEAKLRRNELPHGFDIHVSADPPGPKLGNGGATFTCLEHLEDTYHSDLYKKRVLLIHAGGQSKRMPSTSVLGKIFSPIPTGFPIYQSLDLKLAMYLPFLHKMPPGIFLACADDFLVYNLGDEQDADWSFSETGFTALAHPAPVKIGLTHGVYVLKDSDSIDTTQHVQQSACLEVLQKQTEEVLYRKGAILKEKNHKFPDGVSVDGSVLYTDSAFFFGMDVTKKMIDFIKTQGAICCEIDAYGDFLQALGPKATIDYTKNTSNVTAHTADLISTRENIFKLLNGTDLRILLLNSSRFIHIGTTKEYIHHFCFDTNFQEEMSLHKDAFNCWIDDNVRSGNGDSCNIPKKKQRLCDISSGCIMHCLMSKRSVVPENSVVEYCNFEFPVEVGQNSIVSSCSLTKNPGLVDDLNSNTESPILKLPHNVFIHTVPIRLTEKTGFATVIFHINDNLKKRINVKDASSLSFLGRTVAAFCKSCNKTCSELLPKVAQDEGDPEDQKMVSLWELSLFPIAGNVSESLNDALALHSAVLKDEQISIFEDREFVSMDTILESKDIKRMLSIRNDLFERISDI